MGLVRLRTILNQLVSKANDPYFSFVKMIKFSSEIPASTKEGMEDGAGSARNESGNTKQDQSKISGFILADFYVEHFNCRGC